MSDPIHDRFHFGAEYALFLDVEGTILALEALIARDGEATPALRLELDEARAMLERLKAIPQIERARAEQHDRAFVYFEQKDRRSKRLDFALFGSVVGGVIGAMFGGSVGFVAGAVAGIALALGIRLIVEREEDRAMAESKRRTGPR